MVLSAGLRIFDSKQTKKKKRIVVDSIASAMSAYELAKKACHPFDKG
jgi:hypothetical protein